MVGLISCNDETNYRAQVEQLEAWCKANNLCINAKKTKEMIVDFRRVVRSLPAPLCIGGTSVEVVPSFKYLGIHIDHDLTWHTNTMSVIKKANQRLYFLRRLKRAGLSTAVLTSFYRGAVESILTSCATVWFGNCSAADRKALQRVVKSVQRITGSSFPTIEDIYSSRCWDRAASILKDSFHPAYGLFTPLPSGRRLRSIWARTTRLRKSFFPEVVRMINSCSSTLHAIT